MYSVFRNKVRKSLYQRTNLYDNRAHQILKVKKYCILWSKPRSKERYSTFVFLTIANNDI